MMMGSTQQIEAVTSSLGASARNLAACSVVTSPPSSQAQKDNRQSEMSMRFRILKSLLLVAAWISFGMNFEVIGSTLEDLKLYLNVDYHSVSFSLTLRNIGYLVMVSFSGYLFDRFPRYADLVMCLSSLLIAIPGLLIPITTVYWASAAQFFIQGVSSAFYDLGGNQMILSLWSGISHSPINLMHAGYGVGAILSVQLAKPFIKFDPMDKYRAAVSQGGVNRTLVTDESSFSKQHIDLRVPYWVSAICALVISALFLVAQLGELGRKESKNINCSSIEKQETKLLKENETIAKEKNKSQCFLKRLLFGEKLYKGASLVYMSTQIVLITVVLFCLQGFLTILSKFMLTYLTKGPARFTIDEYTNVQSIFWLLFILSRVATTFAAFRLNNSNASLWFMFILLALNTLITALLLVPAFATGAWNKLFFWLAISMIGFVVAPAHPSMFMVAKHILDDYNSFIIALFSIGLGLSSVAFQEMLGDLLDWVPPSESFLGFENFNSSYIIAHVLFIPALLAFLLFFFLIVIYRNHSHLIKN